MQKTRKLFYEDSHLAEFEAEILACEKIEGQDVYRVVLDRTAFFPEGGGQASDTGWLEGIPVSDVREKDGIIYHICAETLQVGTKVHGKLDYDKHFDKMQNHTGEHIVSGLVHKHFGYENVGFHLGTDVTMDFSGELTKEDLLKIERLANEAVVKNIPVKTEFPDKETLSGMTYRSKIELEGDVRIVTIPGYDVCACCAPHVDYTGEIGMIKLIASQKYKGGTRVTMVCGFRALADYNQKSEQVGAVSVLLSAKQAEIAEAAARMKGELSHTKGQISVLRQQLFEYKVRELEADAPYIALFEKDLNGNEIRTLVNLCMQQCEGVCMALTGDDEKGYQYVAGSRTVDMREFGKEFQEAFQGRGGGKPEMIQGSVQGTQQSITDWLLHKLVKW